MFKKILIAEDFDSINIAVAKAFEEMTATEVVHVKYCDEGLLKIKKALADGAPFDLLISDLSFVSDHRPEKLSSGEELISAVRTVQPELKVIAYSIEDKSYRIRSLFEKQHISGYVFKGRNSIPELKQAVKDVYDDKEFISKEVSHKLKDKFLNEIDDYDIALLQLLSTGIRQDEIAQKLKEAGIAPNSTSAIEKKINKLKISFDANNTTHLVSLAKDLRVI
jgi:two-component system capsular synthesis response regulator RcsB